MCAIGACLSYLCTCCTMMHGECFSGRAGAARALHVSWVRSPCFERLTAVALVSITHTLKTEPYETLLIR